VLKLVEVPIEKPFKVGSLSIRAVRVSHIVPTTGFVVEDKTGTVAYSSDTAPTDRFWEVVNKTDNLKAVIVETSFPNELQDLANVSGHLTPQTLDTELKKLKHDVPVYLYGAKPRHLAKIRAQVRALKRRRLAFLVQGKTYKF
jgi:ribonuclease BN (tRNA processing enzyme)